MRLLSSTHAMWWARFSAFSGREGYTQEDCERARGPLYAIHSWMSGPIHWLGDLHNEHVAWIPVGLCNLLCARARFSCVGQGNAGNILLQPRLRCHLQPLIPRARAEYSGGFFLTPDGTCTRHAGISRAQQGLWTRKGSRGRRCSWLNISHGGACHVCDCTRRAPGRGNAL